jgi:23S rRNA-/tRNA-specific pseudouridylate synthase
MLCRYGRAIAPSAMRWIVGPNDAGAVRRVLSRAGADADAVREGRVFIGRRRVRSDDERVSHGEVVEVAPPRPRMAEPIRLLAETSNIIAVDKPAGIPTIPDHGGAGHSLVALVDRAFDHDEQSALRATSRLDRDVSGVVLFARTYAAAQRLRRARVEGLYERRYVALAARAPAVERGEWNAAIGRARDPRLRAVGGPRAMHAVTRYEVTARAPAGAVLLAVAPITGRTHQIRVHASDAGAPLVGDRAYGGPTRLTLPSGRVLEPRRIALHCARVVVPDDRGGPLDVRAAVPPELLELWALLGGDPGAWERATMGALAERG